MIGTGAMNVMEEALNCIVVGVLEDRRTFRVSMQKETMKHRFNVEAYDAYSILHYQSPKLQKVQCLSS